MYPNVDIIKHHFGSVCGQLVGLCFHIGQYIVVDCSIEKVDENHAECGRFRSEFQNQIMQHKIVCVK